MPNTISQNLQRLQDAKDAIANKIIELGGIVSSGDGLEEFPDDMDSIPSGGGGFSEYEDEDGKAVRFFDYDGTMICDYSPEEFLALSSMPANPTHEGLTAQGWNWSLSDAQTHVEKYHYLDIGQMYTTSDGKTRLHITITSSQLSVTLTLRINGSADVDWGDGSSPSTLTGNNADVSSTHNYSVEGNYIITIGCNGTCGTGIYYSSGSYSFKLLNDPSILTEVHIGDNFSINNGGFSRCGYLTKITIPNGCTVYGQYTFNMSQVSNLVGIILPIGFTDINVRMFGELYKAKFICIPNTVTSIGDQYSITICAFQRLIFPDSLTTVRYKTNYANIYNCSMKILVITDTTTNNSISIDHCSKLTYLRYKNQISISYGGSIDTVETSYISTSPLSFYMVGTSGDKKYIENIILTGDITTLPSNYLSDNHSYMIHKLILPKTLQVLDTDCLTGGSGLYNLTIPASVTQINASFTALKNCDYIKFEGSTPPVVSSSHAWNGDYPYIPYYKIYIPKGTLQTYTTSTNYPSPDVVTYVEY